MRRLMVGTAFVLAAALVGIGCGGSWVESYCNVWEDENYSYMECPIHVFTGSGSDLSEFDEGTNPGKPSRTKRVEQPLIEACPTQVQTSDGLWELIHTDLATCTFIRELDSGVSTRPDDRPVHLR